MPAERVAKVGVGKKRVDGWAEHDELVNAVEVHASNTEAAYIGYTKPPVMTRFPTLVLVLLVLITSVRSQVITLTFEGTLNGAPVPLDSILVMNLTAGGDTTIYFPNNVLVLGSIGVDEAVLQSPVLRNQPNPFSDATDIHLGTERSGQLLMQVHDATGRLEATYAGNLAAGQHRFRFTTATPGVHVLTVIQDGRRAAHRMVAMTGEATGSSLAYAGGTGASDRTKSDRSLFTWTPGDELRYIGYATDASIVHSAAIDEVPVTSATRTFTLFAGRVCPESPTVTDSDGTVYRAVQIGGQCWMAENLKTTRYRDGAPISNVTGNNEWSLISSGAWCNYDNDPANNADFGKLYNGYAVANPNVCPQGWHIPTEAEWQQLELALGMLNGELSLIGGNRGIGENVGGKMKANAFWYAPNTGATNESGFSGLPGATRGSDGSFDYLGLEGCFWSSSEAGADLFWGRCLGNTIVGVYRNSYYRWQGLSVRCVAD